MALILNLETATRNCSVALSRDGVVLAKRDHAGEGYSHAEKLHVFIEEIFAESGAGFNDLQAVSVSRGPGSYTGLRIGVSAAKGFCHALGIPLISVDTTLILASMAEIPEGTIIPLIDARRMEAYTAIYNEKLQMKAPIAAEILTEDSFKNVAGPIYFVGDCQEKARTVLNSPRHHYLDHVVFPSASSMAAFSEKKFEHKEFEDVAYFEPFYLKDFIAGK